MSQIRYLIPDCNQSQGISFPAPAAPLCPFSSHLRHRRCARNEEWGSQPPAITHIPMSGELGFPHKAWTSAEGTPGSPEHRDAALNPLRLCPRKGGNQPVEGRVWNSRGRAGKGFWGQETNLVVVHHAEGVLVACDQVVAVLAQVCGAGDSGVRGHGHCPWGIPPISWDKPQSSVPALTPRA